MAPPPTTIVLVRHGESQVTVDQVVGGHTACSGLSERGRRQAEALRDRLTATGLLRGAGSLYASVLARAVETAEVIAPAIGVGALPVEERCALCELHVGEGDGLSWVDFVNLYGRPPWASDPTVPLSPGSESWAGFIERASAGLQAVAEEQAGRLAVVVCHGGVIEASFAAWGGMVDGQPGRLRPDNTALTIWSKVEASPWRLDRYNDRAHLDGLDRSDRPPPLPGEPVS
ncbi:MAG: histidine phosphatase family protein [Acidimicrobiales bacterium]